MISQATCQTRRIVCLVLCCFLWAAGAARAGQVQDATVFGVVTDESGAVLPGVTVTISGPALQVKELVDVTNGKGEYRLTPLPLGTYLVDFSLSGFQGQRREGLRLTAGFTAKVDVVLKVGAVAETVTVSGASPVVDVKTTSAGTQVTSEILESVPTSRNGVSSLLTLGAGSRTLMDQGMLTGIDPLFGAFGQINNAWITVDGVATTAPFNGASGLNNVFAYDSIAESTIQTVGGAAESPTSGVQLSIIMKSGGNLFHGSVLGTDTTGWMQSNNVTDTLKAQGIPAGTYYDSRWDFDADLGGPILKDRIWFYGSGRGRVESPTIPGAFNADNSPSTAYQKQKMAFGKITSQLSQGQKLINSFSWVDRLRVNGPAVFAGPDSNFYHDFKTILFANEYQWVKGNKILSLVGGGFFTPSPFAPTLTTNSSWSDQVTGFSGGSETKAGIKQAVRRWTAKGTLGWYKQDLLKGNHEFKIGGDYTIASGDFPTTDVGSPYPGNYLLIYRSGVPFEVSVNNNPTEPRSRLAYLGTFFQDSWTINRLTMNLGVRYSNDAAYIEAECRDAAPAPFSSLFPAQCYPENHPVPTYSHVVPRLHVAYDLFGNGKTVLKGGWGQFYQMHGQDELNLYNPLANTTTIFKWHATALPEDTQHFVAGQANLDPNGSDFVSQTLQINNNLANLIANPDLKQPGSNEFSLSIERQLMANFGVRLTGVYSKNFNSVLILNALRPPSSYNIPITNADPGPDGKVGTADDPGRTVTYYDYPASLSGLAFQRPEFINVPSADASFKSVDVTANKRASNGWQLLASFTATKKDIPYVTELTGSGGNGSQRGYFGTNDNPNSLLNAADDTWEWTGRVSGSYRFPLDINLSVNLASYSGTPWARTATFTGGKQIPSVALRVEPIGTERTPVQNLVTLRAEKAFRLMSGRKLSIGYNVINLFNTSYVSSTSQSLGLVSQSGATYGYPTTIGNPRVGELQLKFTF